MPSATRMLNAVISHHPILGLAHFLGLGREVSRKAYMKPGDLPPHLQRDIGFMDGNRPSGRSR